MNYWDKKVIREQLDKRLKFLKDFASSGMPQQGWVKTMREALGRSSLRKIDKGLSMKFVYGFVPEDTLGEMVRNRAKRIALKRLAILDNTMKLEKQSLSDEDKKKALGDMIEKILVD
jgi:hypothetical protein